MPFVSGAAAPSLDPFAMELGGTRLVEASAGTGKTYTICSLVLRLLLEDGPGGEPPPTIDRILVVTFTRAATGALRSRLRSRLLAAQDLLALPPGARPDPAEAWLRGLAAAGEDRLQARLRAALRDFDGAAIHTIHGFCRRVLQDFAFESRAEVRAELLADETSLRRAAVHDFWASATYHAAPAAVAWLQGPGGLGLATMEALGSRLAAWPHLRRVPAVADGPRAAPDGALEACRLAAWSAAAALWRQDGAAAVERLALAAEAKDLHNGSYPPAAIRSRWGADLAELFGAAPGWIGGDAAKLLQKLSSGHMKVNKNGLRPEHPLFDACEDLVAAQAAHERALEDWGLSLRHGLGDWMDRELPARKRRAGQQSFDDLLRALHGALHGPDEGLSGRLAARVRGRYRAALIDEFQDTDQLQYETFRRIFAPHGGPREGLHGGAPLLLIGDPKQAIYGFRGADLFAYLAAADQVGEARTHTLATNYRSDRGLVEAINHLWAPVPRPFLFQRIPFTRVGAHAPDRVDPPGPALELAYLPVASARGRGPGPEAARPLTGDRARRALARAAATAVGRLLGRGARIREGDQARALTAGDVAVLVRTNAEARRMQRVLGAHRIPSVLFSEASVLDQPEADELRRLLAAVVDPADGPLLRAALVCPALGLDAAAIDDLSRDEAAWELWVERFRAAQELWRRAGFLPAARRLLDEAGAPARLLALPRGERRLTNLLHLCEVLHAQALARDLGPESLLAWFDRVRDDPELRRHALGDTAQLRLESDADAVKIVTVHKAKGLEYPYVFCPFLWAGARREKGPAVPFHALDGADGGAGHAGGQLIDIGARLGEATQRSAALASLAEDLRLLYVALTRARHGCWLACGAIHGTEGGALAYVLHAPAAAAEAPDGDGSLALEAWTGRVARLAKDALAAGAAAGEADDPLWGRLRSLAEARPDRVRATYLRPEDLRPSAEPQPVEAEADGRPAPSARASRRPPRRRLRASSYSALLRGAPGAPPAAELEPGRDLDALPPDPAGAPADAPPADMGEAVPLAGLVAGARLGIGLHALMERVDFRDGARWAAAAAGLVARGILPAEAEAPLLAALGPILGTALGAGEAAFRLADIPRADRIDEMGYVLPVTLRPEGPGLRPLAPGEGGRAPRVGPADLARVLAAHPGGALPPSYPARLAALPAAAFSGWLRGSLDLVFRRPGPDGGARWYLLDWKSNRLGGAWADYGPAPLARAMAERHYHLQAQLYTVALHRHLAQRLGPAGYDYERDFGGLFYLFVRGMRPEAPGGGVFFDRPPRSRVEALDALLRTGHG